MVDDGDGKSLDIISTHEALALARQKELDLVLITESADPPIAKILDFNKFLYDENKKSSQIKAKSKKSKVKEFRIGPNIADAEIEMRAKRTAEFLADGNKVKVTVQLRGRQKMHPELGFEKIDKFIEYTKDFAKTEDAVKQMGNQITVTLLKK